MKEIKGMHMGLKKKMTEAGINIELTEKILSDINDGKAAVKMENKERIIPLIDGKRIVDRRNANGWSGLVAQVENQFKTLELPTELFSRGRITKNRIHFSSEILSEIGFLLLPKVAYGVLNGGSASSYADLKKNKSFSPELFKLCEGPFEKMAELCRGRAKGITPGFSNPDGTPGPSFLELRMRNILLTIQKHKNIHGDGPAPLSPMFQMTSILNNDQISRTYNGYRESPLLTPLITETGIDITRVETGIQPLLAALTHSSEGEPRKIFTSAWGKEETPLPFPGGHGQNFAVLEKIYRKLKADGKLFAYLGNVDNLANTPDPEGIAILALSGKPAAFDFSFRTPVDVKGGILVEEEGRLNCVDIGAAVPADWVAGQEESGKPILFNCATGLFNLDYLTENLGRIISNLPLRVVEQDKDPGKYAQTEQVTWEVMGMMDDFLVFGVEKTERFLASKLLMENLMTSGIAFDHPDYPGKKTGAGLYTFGKALNTGLEKVLTERYGLELINGKWLPAGNR
ncbi:MAG: UTP--glucose-1-phosphate uridylyltransferase [Spirochaetales bacterium]|nr:UTP--glucose-1-phosphate uridylyltransferase [Spirochaetales bacterium]